MPKTIIIGRGSTKCTSATSQTLVASRDVSGRVYCYEHIVAIDETHAPTTIEIGLRGGATDYLLVRAAPSAAAISVAVNDPVYALAEYRPYVTFYGATLGDSLEFYWYGYVID